MRYSVRIFFIFKQGLAHDKVKEMRELILERYDKNFDGRLEIDEVRYIVPVVDNLIFERFEWPYLFYRTRRQSCPDASAVKATKLNTGVSFTLAI